MDSLWDTRCITASSSDVEYMTSLGLESNFNTVIADKIFYYQRGLKDVKADTPILVMLHGYPQTNFMWRHIIPLLPEDIPIFLPDLPGYGRSSPLSSPHSKRNVGNAILSMLYSLLPSASDSHPIILAGHDRGARVCQRLSIDAASDTHFAIRGSILLDITPGTAQWQKLAEPQATVSCYHWSFLPNVELATAMILAFGGDKYMRTNFSRWHGKNEVGLRRLKENDAERVYADAFKYEHVIRATCDDYRASAEEEVKQHEDDQREGRKLDSDVLLLYSSSFLASRGSVEIWKEWMGKGNLEMKGLGDGVGHFVAEEAPEKTAEAMVTFYNNHN
ncbi:putative Fluoroacetate dehalogenase [Mollisia scopiformis]|uniref:Putative Fluoroacetate dehalogenase n=1 Tax=Mollisia scopiformis TaxID=149040 RepID=A0A132B7N8_MOLSC|nr:putative Fluoroacetate dehalogenase [Mollisia scopiformis]KUJ08381.1 putative Fluoroacetate dehalogenase [Mollisia scopiformis]